MASECDKNISDRIYPFIDDLHKRDMLALDSSKVVLLCMLDSTRVRVNDSPHHNTGSRSLAL